MFIIKSLKILIFLRIVQKSVFNRRFFYNNNYDHIERQFSLNCFTCDRPAWNSSWSILKGTRSRRIRRHYRQTSSRSASSIFLLLASVCSLRPSVSPLTDPYVGIFRGRARRRLSLRRAEKGFSILFSTHSAGQLVPCSLTPSIPNCCRSILRFYASDGACLIETIHYRKYWIYEFLLRKFTLYSRIVVSFEF